MELYEHNRTAYEAVLPMLESCRRAAVVHPTGTGKSFLAFQLIEDHPDERFLWLFARTFYCLEKDIAKLADILGHSSINTTRIYIMTTGMEHRRKIERLGLVL